MMEQGKTPEFLIWPWAWVTVWVELFPSSSFSSQFPKYNFFLCVLVWEAVHVDGAMEQTGIPFQVNHYFTPSVVRNHYKMTLSKISNERHIMLFLLEHTFLLFLRFNNFVGRCVVYKWRGVACLVWGWVCFCRRHFHGIGVKRLAWTQWDALRACEGEPCRRSVEGKSGFMCKSDKNCSDWVL